MLKSFLLLSAALLFAFTPTSSQGSKPQQAAPEAAPEQAPPAASTPAATATNPVKATAEGLAKAKTIYQIDCSMCHNDNGDGKTDLAKGLGGNMPDFTDGKAMSSKVDGALFIVIRNGKDKMPPEASGRASDTVVWNLIHYIRNMSKSQPPAPAQ
jgi:mono/diheme cytochrome c family protein